MTYLLPIGVSRINPGRITIIPVIKKSNADGKQYGC